MNPAEKRKQAVQVIVLVVLLGVLGASMYYMIRTVSDQGARKPAPQVAAQQTEPAQADAGASATAPPPGAGPGTPVSHSTGGAVPPAGESAAAPSTIALNPNVFRVYSLDPPKNPFVQQERWYEDRLTEYPGYPYLRDQGFFETMDPVVPEIEGLLSEGDEWYEANLQRKETDKRWVIEGRSEDEMIKTSLTLEGPPAAEFDIAWNRSSGVPFSALDDPSWIEGYQLAGGLPDSDDLFQAPTAGGLPVPGGTGGTMLTGGMPQGDMLLCHGVSVQGDKMSALISFNSIPRMVSPGDSLPPRYQVDTITADGVVLTELKNCETRWVPLSSPSAYAGQANSAQLPAAAPYATST